MCIINPIPRPHSVLETQGSAFVILCPVESNLGRLGWSILNGGDGNKSERIDQFFIASLLGFISEKL